MAKIRDDFEGITIVRDAAGQGMVLRAGDTVPDGVKVGAHLTAKTHKTEPKARIEEPAVKIPAKGGPGSSAKAWRQYGIDSASARGLNIDIPEDATKADIIEALEGAGIPTE